MRVLTLIAFVAIVATALCGLTVPAFALQVDGEGGNNQFKDRLISRLREIRPNTLVTYAQQAVDRMETTDEGLALKERIRASTMTCATCQNYVSMIMSIASNEMLLNATKHVMIGECNKKHSDDAKAKKDCLLAVDVMVWALPKIFKALEGLAWDVPFNLCAMLFDNICTHNCCTAFYNPEQIYISLADSKDFSKMRVTWVTLRPANDSDVVFYADGEQAKEVRNAAEPTRTYTFGGWIGTINTAVMTGLKPDTKYYYSVGSSALNRSQTFNFRTFASNIGTPERPARILYIADMAYQSHSDHTVKRMAERVQSGEVDMVIHNGDISYADGFMLHWDTFMRKISPSIGPYAPYMTTPGNHEIEANFTSYRTRLAMSMPRDEQALDGAMYYSIDLGPARILMMDSETPIGSADIPPHEVAWANKVLASQNRKQQPWALAFHHRPLYCDQDSSDCKNFALVLRLQVESTYLSKKVDMVVAGHVHYYLRSYPLAAGSPVSQSYDNPQAPVYVVNGAAGNHGPNQDPSGKQPHLFGGTAKDLGYSIFTISSDFANDKHELTQDFYESVDNTRLDSFTITKNLN